jgi:hypothetical protein
MNGLAAQRRKNAAHGASRGLEELGGTKPRRGGRKLFNKQASPQTISRLSVDAVGIAWKSGALAARPEQAKHAEGCWQIWF